MLFGFLNSFASFQDFINKILAKKQDIFVIVYLNDILIYTENLSQSCIKALRWIFNSL